MGAKELIVPTLRNETGAHTGKYAIVEKLWRDIGWSVWNGTNNARLTNEFFPTAHAARRWAESNGFTMRATTGNPIPE
jgi:hypothetical protein